MNRKIRWVDMLNNRLNNRLGASRAACLSQARGTRICGNMLKLKI